MPEALNWTNPDPRLSQDAQRFPLQDSFLRLDRALLHISGFVRHIRNPARGLSLSQLQLLNFQLEPHMVRCDWIIREVQATQPIDRESALTQESTITLTDAIHVRSLLFQNLSEVDTAFVRAFRKNDRQLLEPVLLGNLRRDSGAFDLPCSLEVKAKRLGFRFKNEHGSLLPLRADE